MIGFRFRPGTDNTVFVQKSLKKLKKMQMKDKQMKQIFQKQYFTKPSKLRHEQIQKRIHVRQKYGV